MSIFLSIIETRRDASSISSETRVFEILNCQNHPIFWAWYKNSNFYVYSNQAKNHFWAGVDPDRWVKVEIRQEENDGVHTIHGQFSYEDGTQIILAETSNSSKRKDFIGIPTTHKDVKFQLRGSGAWKTADAKFRKLVFESFSGSGERKRVFQVD